jgi:hypothetical protein
MQCTQRTQFWLPKITKAFEHNNPHTHTHAYPPGQRGFRGHEEATAELPSIMKLLQSLMVLALESNEIHTYSFFVPVVIAMLKLRTLHLQDNLIAMPAPEATLSNDLKHIKVVTLHGIPCHYAGVGANST